jgi:hypothetical protein
MHYKVKIYSSPGSLENGINDEYRQGYRLSRILELSAPSRFLIVFEQMPPGERPFKEPAVAKKIANIHDWSQCCVCRTTDQPGHYCDDHVPALGTVGGCVSIPDGPSVSETMQAELEPLPITVNGWYKCGNCGADLSNWPKSASAHVCAALIGRVAEGELHNENKKFCV